MNRSGISRAAWNAVCLICLLLVIGCHWGDYSNSCCCEPKDKCGADSQSSRDKQEKREAERSKEQVRELNARQGQLESQLSELRNLIQAQALDSARALTEAPPFSAISQTLQNPPSVPMAHQPLEANAPPQPVPRTFEAPPPTHGLRAFP